VTDAVTERAQVAHLLRRATFGPTAAEIDAAVARGYDATVTALLAPGDDQLTLPALGSDPYATLPSHADQASIRQVESNFRTQTEQLQLWWIQRMATAPRQLMDKLIFFWHGHWATSVVKVRSAPLMLQQLETFRAYGYGDFAAFLKAMLRDPALILWLDGEVNTLKAPNENLGRELMELFTLGIGNYTEDDVKAAARALTGWTVDRATGAATFVPRRHDNTPKTILGQTANFDTDSFADLLLAQSAHPVFLANRLWFRFASGDAMPATTQTRLVAAYQPGRDVSALVRALLTDDAFTATAGQLVKQPVEWLVGALRQLEVGFEALQTGVQRQLGLAGLTGLGQILLEPPSVGGWPSGTAWLTTSSLQNRMRLATGLAALAGPGVVAAVSSGSTADRLAALARLYAVDAWTDRTSTALSAVAGNAKPLLALGLISPEYMVS
jgi:uncharacterized protein (DUF1800 family)